jgi:hypothetical protein
MSASPLSPEEEAAIQAILARAPESQRAELERLLRDENTRVWKASPPELQSSLDLLARGRAKRFAERKREISVAAARSAGAWVTVALVDPAQVAGGRAVVIRVPRQEVPNLVLVPRNATAEDIAAALGALQRSRTRFGDILDGSLRLTVVSARLSPAAAKGAELLRQLRDAPERTIPEFGRVRAIDTSVGPATSFRL